MSLLRRLLAVLIAISLVMGPGVSVVAAVSAPDDMVMNMAHDPGMEMPDCMKSMGGNKADDSCKCCDTKSKCPNPGSCIMKCCKTLGVFRTPAALPLMIAAHFDMGEPEKPPNWTHQPPAPPPRS